MKFDNGIPIPPKDGVTVHIAFAAESGPEKMAMAKRILRLRRKRQWNKTNKPRMKAYEKQWREKNAQKVREYQAAYYQLNKKKINAKSLMNYYRNYEKRRAYLNAKQRATRARNVLK